MGVFEGCNRHYISVDIQSRITGGWSDGLFPDKDTSDAVCINAQGGYQFRLFPGGEENPPLYDMDGIPLYKWDGQAVQPRTKAELDADRAAIPPPPPNEAEDTAAMIVDHEYRLTLLELGLSEGGEG